ncbi:MAG: hypothetical protein FJ039_06245 [Chloroflexi bacterium]|nr:hypothetical protein [Chloroflexota bacterium]
MPEWAWIILSVVAFLAVVSGLIILGIALIVRAARRSRGEGDGRGLRGFTPFRLYAYVISFGGLMAGATGLVFLLQRFFEAIAPSDTILAKTSETRVAVGLAMLAIGGLVWAVHWGFIQRALATQGEAERASPERRIYLRLTAFVATVVLFIALVRLLRWAATADEFSGYPFAATLVWGIVWGAHQRLADREMAKGAPQDGLWQLGTYVTALYALGVGVAGLSGILAEVFHEARESLLSSSSVIVNSRFDSESVQSSIGLLSAGAAVWGYHWLVRAKEERATTGRAAASIIAGIGSSITLVVAAGILLFGFAWWFLAPPGELIAGSHYRFLSMVLAAGIPAGLVAGYFHLDFYGGPGKIGNRAADARNLMLAVVSIMGLGALATAVVFFVGAICGGLSQPARGLIVNDDWWRRSIAIGISTAVLGAPLWTGAWTKWRGLGERLNRDFLRGYLYIVIGISMLAVIGSGAHALYNLLRDATDDTFRGSWLREARWSLGVLIIAGAGALYHWRVTKEPGLAVKAAPEAKEAIAGPAQVRLTALGVPEETAAMVQASLGDGARVAERTATGRELGRLPLTALSALPDVLRLYAGRRLVLVIAKDEVRLYEA